MKPLHWFAIAGVLMVLAIALMVMPTPGEPDLECVPEGQPSSGWVDEESGCPISIESYERHRVWATGTKWDNVAGLGLALAGMGAAGIGVVSLRRSATTPTDA